MQRVSEEALVDVFRHAQSKHTNRFQVIGGVVLTNGSAKDRSRHHTRVSNNRGETCVATAAVEDKIRVREARRRVEPTIFTHRERTSISFET